MFGEELLTDSLTITLFLGIVCLLCLYWYSIQKFDFWRKRGIPQVRPAIPFIGTMYPLLWKPLHQLDLERYQKLGPLYGQYDGHAPELAVADPKLLREILVKEFPTFINRRMSDFASGDALERSLLVMMQGEDWKRMRSVASPIFTTGKLKKMINCMKSCSSTMIESLKKAAENEKPLEVKPSSVAFSMDVIASVIYSIQLDSHKDPNNAVLQNALKSFPPNTNLKIAMYQLWPRLAKWIGIKLFNLKELYFFKDLAIRILKQRKETDQTRSDILEFLMGHVKDFAEEKEVNVGNIGMNTISHDGQKKSNNPNKKSISFDEAIGLNLQFSIASTHTISSTISNALYLLALHPDIQNLTYEEVRDVLQKREGDLTYEAIQEMNHLDNVISETLRLYPPISRLERLTEADFKLGDTGVTIPKGTIIIIPIYAIHRDPKFYPDPERFDIDRFLPEEVAKRDPYTYLPFGSGPRICIGMRFGQLQVKTCLIYLLANFKFHRCPETKVPLEYHVGPGPMRFKNQFLRFEERTGKIPLK